MREFPEKWAPATAIAGGLCVVFTIGASIFASGELAQTLVRAFR